MYQKIVVLFLFIWTLQACTRDDLCPEGTATTPNMIITFYDIEDPNRQKIVEGLSIEANGETVLARTSTDSISLPLNVNSSSTLYQFTRTTIIETDTIIDIDRIQFDHTQNEIYVNRACGFRAEFKLEDATLEDTGNAHWIKNIIIIRDSIVDETKAHLTIYH